MRQVVYASATAIHKIGGGAMPTIFKTWSCKEVHAII